MKQYDYIKKIFVSNDAKHLLTSVLYRTVINKPLSNQTINELYGDTITV